MRERVTHECLKEYIHNQIKQVFQNTRATGASAQSNNMMAISSFDESKFREILKKNYAKKAETPHKIKKTRW
jgi:hypothetical protein